jgi:hypothetical protein
MNGSRQSRRTYRPIPLHEMEEAADAAKPRNSACSLTFVNIQKNCVPTREGSSGRPARLVERMKSGRLTKWNTHYHCTFTIFRHWDGLYKVTHSGRYSLGQPYRSRVARRKYMELGSGTLRTIISG